MAPTKKKAVKKKTLVKKPVKSKSATKATVKKKTTVKKSAPKIASVKKKAVVSRGVPEILRDAALKVLDERQADDIVTVDARGRSAITDYVIIATGRSGRQLAAMADYVRVAFEKNGARRVRTEGLSQGDWVLVDAGDVIVHLFRPEVRDYYGLEAIWKKTHGA